MLDYYDVMYLVSKLDRQVEVDGYLWAIRFIDYSIIAHCAHEWNLVPMAKYSVTDPVFWFVAFFVKIVCEAWHF